MREREGREDCSLEACEASAARSRVLIVCKGTTPQHIYFVCVWLGTCLTYNKVQVQQSKYITRYTHRLLPDGRIRVLKSEGASTSESYSSTYRLQAAPRYFLRKHYASHITLKFRQEELLLRCWFCGCHLAGLLRATGNHHVACLQKST